MVCNNSVLLIFYTAIMQVFVDSICPSFLINVFMLPGVVVNGGLTNVIIRQDMSHLRSQVRKVLVDLKIIKLDLPLSLVKITE